MTLTPLGVISNCTAGAVLSSLPELCLDFLAWLLFCSRLDKSGLGVLTVDGMVGEAVFGNGGGVEVGMISTISSMDCGSSGRSVGDADRMMGISVDGTSSSLVRLSAGWVCSSGGCGTSRQEQEEQSELQL